MNNNSNKINIPGTQTFLKEKEYPLQGGRGEMTNSKKYPPETMEIFKPIISIPQKRISNIL
jgi:hypothetical protein